MDPGGWQQPLYLGKHCIDAKIAETEEDKDPFENGHLSKRCLVFEQHNCVWNNFETLE